MVAWLAGVAALVGAVGYTVVSLNRWEWNRALFFGLVALITEVALATGLVLERLSRLQAAHTVNNGVREVLRETRPPSPNRFDWLDPTKGQSSVFITFLVGGGAVLSALAWLIDHAASHTTTPLREGRLARRLEVIGYPSGGLVVDDMTVLAQAVPGCDDRQLQTLLRRAGRRV